MKCVKDLDFNDWKVKLKVNKLRWNLGKKTVYICFVIGLFFENFYRTIYF